MTQSERSRDAGVTFENTEGPSKTRGSAQRDDGNEGNEVVSTTERGRDAGVVFASTASHRQANAPAVRKDEAKAEAVSNLSERERDAGVIFGKTESHRQAGAPPVRKDEVRKDEVILDQSQRSHDAGITFGKTERDRQAKVQGTGDDGNVRSMAESMIRLAKASAKFTFDQIQSGFWMLTDPGKALRRVQHSIDNFSRAMNEPVEDTPSRPNS